MQKDFDITRSKIDAGYFFDRNRDIMGAVSKYENMIETEKNAEIRKVYIDRRDELLAKIKKEQ